MTYIFKIIFIIFTSQLSFSHPGGHGGPQKVVSCKENNKCTKSEISEAGTFVFKFFAESGRLPESWDINSNLKSTKQMILRDQDIWVVNFTNEKLSDSQKNLHILISNDGFLIGVTSEISNLKEIQNYDSIIGIALILVVSLLAYKVIFRKKKKTA